MTLAPDLDLFDKLALPRLADTDQEAKELLALVWDDLSPHAKAIAPFLRLTKDPQPQPTKPDPINEIQLTHSSALGPPGISNPDPSAFRPWAGRPKRAHAYPNADRIPERRAPYGFVLAMHLQGTHYDNEAEKQWLAEGQHSPYCTNISKPWNRCCEPPDLAPEVLELRANFINAVSLNQPQAENDDGSSYWLQIADDVDRTPGIYELPTPREQALAEWERQSWLNGPLIKYRYDITADGKLGLTLISIRHASKPEMLGRLTPDQIRAIALWLHAHHHDNSLPHLN